MKILSLILLSLFSFSALSDPFIEVSGQGYYDDKDIIEKSIILLGAGIEHNNLIFRGYFNGDIGADIGVQFNVGSATLSTGLGYQVVNARKTFNIQGVSTTANDTDSSATIWVEAERSNIFIRASYTEVNFNFTGTVLAIKKDEDDPDVYVTGINSDSDKLYLINIGYRFK